MKTLLLAALTVSVASTVLMGRVAGFFEAPAPKDRNALDQLFRQGNYKECYDGLRALALDAKDDPRLVGQDLTTAISCLMQLNRADEIDEFRDAVIEVHKENWRLLEAAAHSYIDGAQSFGFLVAGKFHRGQHRGGGKMVNAVERDRARAVQLLARATELARTDADRPAAGRCFSSLAAALLVARNHGEAWKLQSLTPLDSLPDYDEFSYGGWGQPATSAPVNDDGSPVYYRVPAGFKQAKNDGERFRWAFAQAVEMDAGLLNSVRMALADFLYGQFGTQTIGGYPMPFGAGNEAEADIAGLESLKDEETIARLATGVRRFTLPDEFNPIKIYQAIAADPRTGYGQDALGRLVMAFENRRQFARAAEYLRQSIAQYGDPGGGKAQQLNQIVGAWGAFEPTMTQPAGRGATLDFVYRNGRRVRFEAHEINVAKLLADVKEYLSSRPPQLDWQRMDVSDVGNRLIALNQQQYLGRHVAGWDLDLEPREGHRDRRVSVTTPLQKAGAYLISARMQGGNTCFIVAWLDDTAIVKKSLDQKVYYFVADARNGRPIPGADVQLLGWRSIQVPGKNEFRTETKSLGAKADEYGQVRVPTSDLGDQQGTFQWVTTATTPEGRLAYLGFNPIWGGQAYDPDYDQVKTYTITDRPVYRPGQSVRFKFWVAHARYDQPEASDFAGKSFQVLVQNPKGEKVFERGFTADPYGGFDGSFELASDATLGVYGISIPNMGGGSFRVEEYKKPEFEVSVEAPSKPVMLGEKVSAKVEAKYYFGGPVAEGKVKYKVTRTTATAQWYPAARWDWLFGAGYWWFAADSAWYPGWDRWGVTRPAPWWLPRPSAPPEVVAEGEVPLKADGTYSIEIDTGLAKAAHPDQDHRYEISASVTDQSRRTIDGSGTVLVARKPFSVTTWLDRGHYRAGDSIEAGLKAQTLDHKPVAGKGTLKLLKVNYDAESNPVETPVESWPIELDGRGEFRQTVKAAAPGQYRLSAVVADEQGHSVEGGYLFSILGQGFDGASFRFNDLEIIPDRKEYRAGESVKLLINANQVDSTVLLFVRPTNNTYLPPKVVTLRGKSLVEDVGVVPRDMPNFFIEALSVAGGKVHSEVREIAVPPESRVAEVSVEPSQPTYKPGQKAKVKVRLTGPDGRPFVGSTVLAVYDKAVEYISGGSNVPEIKEFFWQWKRSFFPQTESSLDRSFGSMTRPGEVAMRALGPFGGAVELDVLRTQRGGYRARWNTMLGRGRMGGMMGGMAMAAPMAAAPAPMSGPVAAAKAESAERFEVAADGVAMPAALEKAPAGEAAQPVVRTNFADTAYWAASVTPDANGNAEVEFNLPESLTTWKVRSWALGPGTKVGQGESEIITSKDLLVRLQAPRFFVQKDEVVLSANVHNKLKSGKSVQVVLETEGSVLEPLDESSRTLSVAAGGEARVDWRVRVAQEGQAVIRMKAISDEDSDAAQMTFPAYVHGMLKMEAVAGSIRPDGQDAEVTLNVPADRRPEQSRLEVRYSPTLAGALVDALPYLADYPYGCTEQTLNRFLPTVITQRILIDMGVDLKSIRDKRTNLNAQQLGDAKERAAQWRQYEHNPVYDIDEVRKMASAGLQRLADMQLSDGGWGWFSGFGEYASPHTTALVVHGLQIARGNDLAVPPEALQRGVAWLQKHQAEQVKLLHNGISETRPYKQAADDTDALVFMVLADAGLRDEAMLGFLDRDRVRLSLYARGLFGLALEKLGEKEKLAAVLQNFRQYVVEDAENQTAYLKLPNEGYWWWWYGSEIETQAFYLKLLARTEPKGELAPRLVKYLLNNRQHGHYWKSTRDTSYCIEAMADYLKASGEDRPDMTVTISLDGRPRKEVKITPSNLFAFDNALVLEGKQLESGAHKLTFARRGTGPLYFNAYLTNFTLEDPIARAGLEVKVGRKVYRLVREDKSVDVAGGRGQAVSQRVEKYRREPISDGAVLKSGELVEVELEIDSKNDYEYLLFEDYKAAGFEPVEVRSGYNGNDLGAYVEFRDDRVAFFARTLARGKHSVSYRLRAEIPGRFHALPARAQAMYAPELRGNSDEIRLGIED
ncbi:MG2 domain protein [Aquisphaera giovannonii]|uniref:MG2 domain protein n=1 Tax=Aquisphaera giovannonii TaxID=406548 RepID=A0A5B9VZY9_9BACT|nr:MG2 domain-containing protein [Aquisphaera giovannonii]QEH33355.1 MG2 domain protein [Aquisphaera giovannonii]